MDSNWNEVMEKIAYRDARKYAFDLERTEKLKDKNEAEHAEDNSFLTNLLPTPMLSTRTLGLDFHQVGKTLNRARRYSVAEKQKSKKDKLSKGRYEKRKKSVFKDPA